MATFSLRDVITKVGVFFFEVEMPEIIDLESMLHRKSINVSSKSTFLNCLKSVVLIRIFI